MKLGRSRCATILLVLGAALAGTAAASTTSGSCQGAPTGDVFGITFTCAGFFQFGNFTIQQGPANTVLTIASANYNLQPGMNGVEDLTVQLGFQFASRQQGGVFAFSYDAGPNTALIVPMNDGITLAGNSLLPVNDVLTEYACDPGNTLCPSNALAPAIYFPPGSGQNSFDNQIRSGPLLLWTVVDTTSTSLLTFSETVTLEYTTTTMPEPISLALLGSGLSALALLAGWKRKRKV